MEQANFLVHISFYIDDKTLAENLKKKMPSGSDEFDGKISAITGLNDIISALMKDKDKIVSVNISQDKKEQLVEDDEEDDDDDQSDGGSDYGEEGEGEGEGECINDEEEEDEEEVEEEKKSKAKK